MHVHTRRRLALRTYRGSDRKNERGPILEVRAEKYVGNVCHEQEYGGKSGAGCAKLGDHD